MTDWIDGQGRQIDYLRLSVTDRCDFRCVYCMAEDMRFLPRQQVLTLEEIERVARLFVAGGVRKLRLTGGRWCGPASSACASAWRHCRGCANCA
ncbi:Cyclic pyranopterin monophosphate synthase [Pseudomonas aeruginosa]|nr:Cyclic pyranopterin monophosphate synthase [Pseudomonas aeruginosa]CRQ31684.1 Cyclic pyranopterin monophosphate synthase [Pseudomonas aeruginosa]